jgi:TolB protein
LIRPPSTPRIALKLHWLLAALLLAAAPAFAQDWFRTGTGLGVERPRVAVADLVPRAAEASAHAKLFTEVLRGDLDFSGILELVSPSFQPVQSPAMPLQLNTKAWSDAPASAQMVAFGNLQQSSSEAAIEAWLYDVRNPSSPPVVAKVYRGAPTDAQIRKFAHQFADEIIGKLSGGLPGVASTQIAFISNRTGSKELWVMDYDGANQHALTALRTISLMPRWSPDTSRIAFACYIKAFGILSPQICMFSMELGRPVAFPRFHGSNSAPAWSPDGSQLMFSSSMSGYPEIYSLDASGSHLKRLTFSAGDSASTSPAWNPKTGQAAAFISDRGGFPQLYLMNSDGTNTRKLDLPDMGYVIDPAWSPNGQLLAFSWRRPNGNYDIYVMDVTSRQIAEITRDAGRNERPSWAPDGRHIVFESTRGGSRQIWVMLADGTHAHALTQSGANESPNWSPR